MSRGLLALFLGCALARNAQAQANDSCEQSEAYADYRTGLYWGAERGSNAPALEMAERYFHLALSKLERVPEGSCRAALERKVLIQLRLLYQQDGLPLVPPKGWNAGRGDLFLPGVALTAAVFVSNDPAPSIEDSRMRRFTAEAAFINSELRLGGTPTPMTELQRWLIVRTPTQVNTRYGVALRENLLGRFTFDVRSTHVDQGQITSYYLPEQRNDTEQTELHLAYDRVFPIDPFVDLGFATQFSRVERRGFVEFIPEYEEEYTTYAFAASLSRTLGHGRLTLAGTYLFADIPDLPIGVTSNLAEGEWIRGLSLEYANEATSAFNPHAWGSFAPYRTVPEGFAVYVGFTDRPKVNGLDTLTNQNLYAGLQFEGPSPTALQLEAAAFRTRFGYLRPDDPEQRDHTDSTRGFASLRLLALPKLRLLHMNRVDPQPLAVGNAQLAELTLVFPLSWEFALDGPSNYNPTDTKDRGNDYAHFRIGSELWLRSLSFEPLGGGLLLNTGFDLVHYYEIGKTQHLAHASAQLGW